MCTMVQHVMAPLPRKYAVVNKQKTLFILTVLWTRAPWTSIGSRTGPRTGLKWCFGTGTVVWTICGWKTYPLTLINHSRPWCPSLGSEFQGSPYHNWSWTDQTPRFHSISFNQFQPSVECNQLIVMMQWLNHWYNNKYSKPHSNMKASIFQIFAIVN